MSYLVAVAGEIYHLKLLTNRDTKVQVQAQVQAPSQSQFKGADDVTVTPFANNPLRNIPWIPPLPTYPTVPTVPTVPTKHPPGVQGPSSLRPRPLWSIVRSTSKYNTGQHYAPYGVHYSFTTPYGLYIVCSGSANTGSASRGYKTRMVPQRSRSA
ncbi:hypothetical protein HYFRA_00005933 [Hymenoscyphus fraxineus]|uniref:Uncharacterized protein n=1 Tax=Hymenoscyphus fraxineus TaxID=746836 RepID=A0A9N9KU50_9HELO|nr:hypothetical protein HYFRA_00005933 [Hymenoscyphus fraxineus]